MFKVNFGCSGQIGGTNIFGDTFHHSFDLAAVFYNFRQDITLSGFLRCFSPLGSFGCGLFPLALSLFQETHVLALFCKNKISAKMKKRP